MIQTFLHSHSVSHSCHTLISLFLPFSVRHKYTDPVVECTVRAETHGNMPMHMTHATGIQYRLLVHINPSVTCSFFSSFSSTLSWSMESEEEIDKALKHKDEARHTTGTCWSETARCTFEWWRLIHVWIDTFWFQHSVLSYDRLRIKREQHGVIHGSKTLHTPHSAQVKNPW